MRLFCGGSLSLESFELKLNICLMANQKSQKMPSVVLRKLESAISDQVPEHINVILELADLLNVSKESIYRRLRGTTAFTFEELWLLFKTFGISIDSLFAVSPTNHSRLRFVSVHDLGILDYCKELIELHSKLSNGKSEQVFCLASHIPLVHLLKRRPIAQFKLDLWSHLYKPKSHVFVDDILKISQQKSATKATTTYHEMWSTSATKQILNELEYAIACGLHFDKEYLFTFFEGLIQLVEEFVFSTNNNYRVLYQQELDVQMNVMISFGVTDSLLVHFGDDMMGVACSHARFKNQKSWIKGVQSQCIRITGQSERQKHNFFVLLTEPIFKVAATMLTGNQLDQLRTSR